MAQTIPLLVPSLVGKPGINFYNKASALPLPGAVWRRGDILTLNTNGTITEPAPTGALAAVVPAVAPTVGSTASSGAPVQFLFYYYTYKGSGTESLPSQEYPITVGVGTEGTITVPSTGAPAGADHFALYVGTVPGGEWQQVASTALGSAATIPYPLTNSIGITRGATNAGSNIVGLALDDFDVTYAPMPQNAATYSNRSLFGVDVTAPPVGFLEQYEGFYIKPTDQTFEFSLVQPWYNSLLNATAGLLYSTTYNCFAADTSQSNKVLTIVGKAQGSTNPTYGDQVGGVGDTGARVICRFNSGTIA